MISIFKKLFGRFTVDQSVKNNITSNEPAIKSESQEGKANLEENNPNENIKRFQTKVVGVTFAQRQSHLKRLAKKIEDDFDFPDISLIREPNNKHDGNAIKVIWHEYNERTDTEKDIHVGYIAAHVAESLAKDMDNGVDVTAEFEEILGGNDVEDNDDVDVTADFESNIDGYDGESSYGMLITVQIIRNNN
ncbi:MAG: HIRAN domain-containing protein [Desulfobulbaceae bacterium]|nr:HIRAN domain-containing protein [Desulfobulbaceae bacterium]